MEPATGGWIQRGRNVTLQNLTRALALVYRIRLRDRRKQRLRIRVEGSLEKRLAGRKFRVPTKLHDRYAIADVSNDGEIMGDVEIS
jgi:hypothetical protein